MVMHSGDEGQQGSSEPSESWLVHVTGDHIVTFILSSLTLQQ